MDILPWYRVYTKAMSMSKDNHGYGEPENVFHLSVQKPHLPVRACKLPWFMEGSIRLRMEICVNSGLPIAMESTVLAPKQCLYQKEAKGMESLKM